MTKQELQEMINESVARALNTEVETLDEVAAAEAEYELAIANEAAAFMYLNMISESMNIDTLNEAKFTQEELEERKKETAVFKAKWEALENCKSKRERAALQKSLGMGDPLKIKNHSAKKIAKKLGKGFTAVGDKVVTTFKNPDGSLNKKAVGIAAAATAVASSIAAAAIVANKKKAKEEDKEEK